MRTKNFTRRHFISSLSTVSVAVVVPGLIPDNLNPINFQKNPNDNPADSPLFEENLVVRFPRAAHGYRGNMGDFILLKDGSMMMSYTSLGAEGITSPGIEAIKSTDLGKTWGKPFTVIPNPRPPNAKGIFRHPGFLRLPNGEILISYIYNTLPTTPYYGHSYYRRSDDEGQTWGDQFIMTPHPGLVNLHNDRLQVLSTGRILAIAEYKAYMPDTNDHNGYVGISFFSDDLGYSWQVSQNTVDMYPVEVQEPDAVELKDGRILMFGRTYTGHPVRAYSCDGGQTWGKGEEIPELNMPYAGLPTVRRIPSTGDLLFIWITEKSIDKNDQKIQRRCALSSAISQDEGKTFLHQRNIARDPDDDFGYQCIEFVNGNTAVIGYHCRDGIRVARIGIDWFYGR
jgi:sialidase-1